MKPPELGTVVTFISNPMLVHQCLPSAGVREHAGEVTGVHEASLFQPGNIGDLAITVRGRSKQSVRLSYVSNYVREWPSWASADAAIAESSPSK